MIIVRLQGGMGNQMFQYAAGRALSLRHSVPLRLDIALQSYLVSKGLPVVATVFRSYMLHYFAIKAAIAEQREIPWWLRLWGPGRSKVIIDGVRRRLLRYQGRERSYTFDPRFFALGSQSYLDGDWQSYKYFESVADDIRREFTIVKQLSASVVSFGNEMRNCASVSMHMRRGDYVGNPFYVALGKDYYDRALAKIQSHRTVDHIYVFSDDPDWCKEHYSFPVPTTFVGKEFSGENGIGDFWLMQQCKHNIIANSSFSWWAAWLNTSENKIVVAPRDWFADPRMTTDDLIPPSWIRV